MVLYYNQEFAGIPDPVASNNVTATFRNPYHAGDPITFHGLQEGYYKVTLVDITGRTIESQTYNYGQSISFKAVPSAGLFILKLSSKEKTLYQSKMIISR